MFRPSASHDGRRVKANIIALLLGHLWLRGWYVLQTDRDKTQRALGHFCAAGGPNLHAALLACPGPWLCLQSRGTRGCSVQHRPGDTAFMCPEKQSSSREKLLELCLLVVGHKVLAVPAVQWVSVSAMVHWGCTRVWCD